nr:BTAD domain-containing putative transcriptional regulator [Dactylosporangium thailandense]
MDIRLFGEVRLFAAGRLLDAGAPRQRAVLAALAVDAGRPVPIETVVDRVWGEEPPAEARNVLYSHVSRLRRLVAIERRSAGYLLDVPPETVDLHRFAALVQTGGAAALAEALALWDAPPLAGIGGDWADAVRTAWHRRRLDAVVRWGELRLEAGHPGEVAAAVADLTAEYPLAEQLEVLVLRALLAAGQRTEALERYGHIRRRLADELGTEPGPELRGLHERLLGRAGAGNAPAGNAGVIPAQLPAGIGGFAGRAAELRLLDDLRGTGTVILSGTAGVGKTTLAVHWAHRVRDAFPGGQLYVNLRGFDPGGDPVTPAAAVRDFLDALDVPASRRPASLEAQIGLYRSLLAGRRVLVVLDNARDAGQVRPLLPGAPGCQAVVTSRDELVGLVAEGARPVPVDLLPTEEAHAVLRERLGAARVEAEPGAAAEIAELCARLPLALAVVAARAATRPAFRLGDLARQLREARGGLDEFAGADPATDPRAVFSWSYLRLSPAAARLFRLLGLHPGPDLGTRAARALAGTARPALAELTQAHLLTEIGPGRYACHDLLRSYAAELVAEHESAGERAAATRRLLGYYRHSAYLADGFVEPRREVPPEFAPLPAGVEPERIVTHAEALAWFTAERPVLLRAVHQPSAFDREVWEIVWASRRFLKLRSRWHEANAMLAAALEAARRLDDGPKQAFAHCFLGCSAVWLDRHDEAGEQLDAALARYAEGGDRIGQAYTHHYWAWLLEKQGRHPEALGHAERSLALFAAAGHRAGEAKARNAVGWFHALAGDHAAAVHHCERALALQQELGDGLEAAQTWHSLGFAHHALGDDTRALLCYKSAEDLFHRSGYLFNEALVLTASADIHAACGRHDRARAERRRAYDILRPLGHPLAEEVRAHLEDSHD